MPSRICRPISGWLRMTTHSSGVSDPGLSRIESEMPILPMSWSSTPRPSASSSATGSPWARARASEYAWTRREWSSVPTSRVARTEPSASSVLW